MSERHRPRGTWPAVFRRKACIAAMLGHTICIAVSKISEACVSPDSAAYSVAEYGLQKKASAIILGKNYWTILHRKKIFGDIPELHWSSIFPADFDLLRWLAPINILITHVAPESHRHGFQIIGDLASEVDVRWLSNGSSSWLSRCQA